MLVIVLMLVVVILTACGPEPSVNDTNSQTDSTSSLVWDNGDWDEKNWQ